MSYDKTDTCSTQALTTRKHALNSLGHRGFTMLELLVVVAIIGILAILAIPAYSTIKDMARTARGMGEIRELEKIINAYSIDHGGAYPTATDLSEIGQSALRDPWGNPYVYNNNIITPAGARKGFFADMLNEESFDLYSLGADRLTDKDDISSTASLDDIVRTGDGGFVGTVKQYKQ